MDQPLSPEVTPETPAAVEPTTTETSSAPASPESPATVQLSQDEYDRLQQASAVAEQLAPLAQAMQSDPYFAQRLMQAPVAPTYAAPQPAQPEVPEDFNARFYENPEAAISSFIEKKYVPQTQRAEQELRTAYNRQAIQLFRQRMQSADRDFEGVVKYFDRIITATSDPELAKYGPNELEQLLNNAWRVSLGEFYSGARAKMPPKEAAPPIAGAPLGQAPSATQNLDRFRKSPDFPILMQQAAMIGKDEAWVLKTMAEAEEQEKLNA